jgi:methionine-rich copper-binding protein CopC
MTFIKRKNGLFLAVLIAALIFFIGAASATTVNDNTGSNTVVNVITSVQEDDTTAPTISTIDPANNAVNVPTNKIIKITYNENIKNGTGWIELKNNSGTAIPFTTNISSKILTITPTNPLTTNKYTISIHTGAITDLANNPAAANSSKFTTDGTAPTITTIDPANNTINVPTNKIIKITYNENIKNGTGWIELKNNSGTAIPFTTNISSKILTITPTNPLTTNKYTISIHTGAITDLANNPAAANSSKFSIGTTSAVKLVFIHHSSGGNWLANGNGNLGTALNSNNYYVSETNYGWSAQPGDNLGDRTDTVNWPEWFTDAKMPYVYASDYHSAYTNIISNPGGENEIIMFKSCFPNSEVGDSIDEEKAIYNSLLPYFAAHPDKFFVLITPPGETNVASYQLTRDLCNWLVDDTGWLSGYSERNVMVFDFYGVLSEVNSHHRWVGDHVEHVYASDYDGTSPYHDGDDHPNAAGNQKATTEFLSLLNHYYSAWKI